jgi:hypothetical protein
MHNALTRLDSRMEEVLGYRLTALYDQVEADEPLTGAAGILYPAHAALCEAETDAASRRAALARLTARPHRVDERGLARLDAALAQLEDDVELRDRREAELTELLDSVQWLRERSRRPSPGACTASRPVAQ